MPQFSNRSRLIALALTALMAGICACAVTEKLLSDDTINGRAITLEDGRHGRILYLLNGEAAIEIQRPFGKAEVTNMPWSTAFRLAGLSRGDIGLVLR